MLSAAMKFIFKKARELSKKKPISGRRAGTQAKAVNYPIGRIDDDMREAKKLMSSKDELDRETGEQLMGHLAAEKKILDTGQRRRKAKKDRRQRKFEDELPRN